MAKWNNCNNFSVDGGIPRKIDGTYHIMRREYAHDAVYCPFFRVYLYPPKNYYINSLILQVS